MQPFENGAIKRNENRILPELLSPAGSPASMMAAINAGADAVYFGMPEFNARIGADNFTRENLGEYLDLCHLMGVKAYITLNTQIYDRETDAFLETARFAYEAGVDAAIVGDLGAAALLREHLPGLPIHASTQLSGHCHMSGAELSKLGFSRMVCAREMSLEDIKTFTEKSPIEAEIFIHGALCVCHSGQCLFSSLVGGRSGNRGLCAQPCRLPYKIGKRYEGAHAPEGDGGKSGYHLSLKDSCLASHIPEIIGSGAASLKIEGRMKAPDYVGRVTAVYRRLLDEGRRATKAELDYLAAVFSRGGFTDGYFTGNISREMLGVRSDADKESSKKLSGYEAEYLTDRKAPICMYTEIHKNKRMRLTLSLADGRDVSVTVEGEMPLEAQNRPTDAALAEKNLLKLGSSRFVCREVKTDIDDGLMVPVSALNSLRRDGVAALEMAILAPYKNRIAGVRGGLNTEKTAKGCEKKRERIAIFTELSQVPRKAYGYFHKIYLPASEFARHKAEELSDITGVALPEVIFDSEREEVRELLALAKCAGARHALVGNLGHIDLAKEAGLELHGSFRLNVSNSHSARTVADFGFSDVIVHPELTLPKCRDVARTSPIGCLAVTYGRVPLMVLEKCVICEGIGGKRGELCPIMKTTDKVCRGSLTDRTGATFPLVREFSHRNVLYNSVPVYMADKRGDIERAAPLGEVFIFSDETCEEAENIISAYEKELPAKGRVRRMGVKDN